MKNELKKATILATGKHIEVYRLSYLIDEKPAYCDFANCKTIYKESELKF